MKCFLSAIIFYISIPVVFPNQNELKTIPDFLKICHRNDPNLNDCVKQTIEDLRPMLSQGVDDLLIPPCEPLQVPQIEFKQNAGAISMNSEYTNILVFGLSNFEIRNVRIDPVEKTFQLDLWFPDLKMTANYNINGKLLLMPLIGHGTCNGNFTDIDVTVSIKTNQTTVNNRDHLKVSDLIVDFNMSGAYVRMNDLFNGDAELCEAMNNFLNENWRSIAAEMRPALKDAIGSILQGITERLFAAFTVQQILPD